MDRRESKKSREAATACSNLQTLFFFSSRYFLAALILLETGTSWLGWPTIVIDGGRIGRN